MEQTNPSTETDKLYEEAQKRVRKIKKFYKELASWAGTSIFLIALDMFLSGGVITWSKYPVFFWGIAILLQFFSVLPLLRMDEKWEDKMMRKFTGRQPSQSALPDNTMRKEEDYSDELLQDKQVKEKELADLSEYRKLKRPWKDEDLV